VVTPLLSVHMATRDMYHWLLNAHVGILTRVEYRNILVCLHPDPPEGFLKRAQDGSIQTFHRDRARSAHGQAPLPDRGCRLQAARRHCRCRVSLRVTDRHGKVDYKSVLRCFGYGVPNLGRLLSSLDNSLTLVAESELRPFFKDEGRIKTREMRPHELPCQRIAQTSRDWFYQDRDARISIMARANAHGPDTSQQTVRDQLATIYLQTGAGHTFGKHNQFPEPVEKTQQYQPWVFR